MKRRTIVTLLIAAFVIPFAVEARAQVIFDSKVRKVTHYVGHVLAPDGSDTGALVSITVGASPIEGNVEVVGYVCDGSPSGQFQYFRGLVPESGGSVLVSLSGQANLSVTVSARTSGGTTGSLQDGTSNTFTAPKMASGGGFYTMTLLPDGQFFGDLFRTRGRIRGRVTDDGVAKTITGEFILPNGKLLPFSGTIDISGEPGDYRLIISEDGVIVGASRKPYIEQENGATGTTVRGQFTRP